MAKFNQFKFNGKIRTLKTCIGIEVQIGNFALNNPSGEPKHGSSDGKAGDSRSKGPGFNPQIQ